MKFKSISPLLAAIALLLGATASFSAENSRLDANKQSDKPNIIALPTQESTPATGTTFVCDTNSNPPITIVRQEGSQEDRPILHWKSEYFPSPSNAEELCQQVSTKLQNYYENGELNKFVLTAGQVDSQSVVCIEDTDGSCAQDRVLFALQTTEDPSNALSEMIAGDLQEQLEKDSIRTRGHFRARFGFDWLLF